MERQILLMDHGTPADGVPIGLMPCRLKGPNTMVPLLVLLLMFTTPAMAQTIPVTGTAVETRFVPVRDYRGIVSWHVEFTEIDETAPPPNAALLRQQIAGLEGWVVNASGSRKVLYESILSDLREALAGCEVVRH
jgi:hypothetical protein